MAIFQTARFTVKPDARARCEAAIHAFIAYIKVNEPGTLRYTSLQQSDDPNSFLHFFIFENEAARDKHRSSDGVKGFTGVLYPELIGEVEFTEYTMLVST